MCRNCVEKKLQDEWPDQIYIFLLFLKPFSKLSLWFSFRCVIWAKIAILLHSKELFRERRHLQNSMRNKTAQYIMNRIPIEILLHEMQNNQIKRTRDQSQTTLEASHWYVLVSQLDSHRLTTKFNLLLDSTIIRRRGRRRTSHRLQINN